MMDIMGDNVVCEPNISTYKDLGFFAVAEALPVGQLHTQIYVSHSLKNNSSILEAVKFFGVPITLLDRLEHAKFEPPWTCLVDDFDEDVLETFNGPHSLIGPTALVELSETKSCLPHLSHPLYCFAMKDLVIGLTGFQDKQYLGKLVKLVRAMGGKVSRKMGCNITHLVANRNFGKRYEYAAQHSIPIMTDEWIIKSWEKRKIVGSLALDDNMLTYRRKPFMNMKMCFYGYEHNDKEVMMWRLKENGGEPVNLDNPECTHVVINDLMENSAPPFSTVNVICGSWFWYSIQCKACMPISKFPFKVNLKSESHNLKSSPQGSQSSLYSWQSQIYTPRKQWLPDLVPKTPIRTISNSNLEWELDSNIDSTPHDKKELQRQAFFELLLTEKNYVTILNIIMTMKNEIENSEIPLLAPTEVKLIFGNLLPIHEVHTQLLEELVAANANWMLDKDIGFIILKYISQIRAAYPAFVNFYEDSRKSLLKCMETNSKFNIYLQKCKAHPMCGRQALDELMIRPIQRLGSLVLLLKSLAKTYSEGCQEYQTLLDAISNIKCVIKQVNEDKRQTEKMIQIFDVFNKIHLCPEKSITVVKGILLLTSKGLTTVEVPWRGRRSCVAQSLADLVSAHRQLVLHFEATELTDKMSGRGDLLIFFLFTDVLEVARVKSRPKFGKAVENSASDENSKRNNGKLYKHITLIPLTKVWRFIDVMDDENCDRTFAIAFRSNLGESYYVFDITSEAMQKRDLLRIMCEQKANFTCKVNPDYLLLCKKPSTVGITSNDISPVSITKAAKNFAIKAKNSVTQALHIGVPKCATRLDISALEISYDTLETDCAPEISQRIII